MMRKYQNGRIYLNLREYFFIIGNIYGFLVSNIYTRMKEGVSIGHIILILVIIIEFTSI